MNTTIDNLNGLLIRDIIKNASIAGPSPMENNERIEIFFLGCNKAMEGNPCKGCFNETTWDKSKAEFSHDPILLAQSINEHPNNYITIGGGEPIDQIDNLIILCNELKKYNKNILLYTHYKLQDLLEKDNEYCLKTKELLKYVDIVIDGEFVQEEKLYNENANDGLFNSVGSGNQIIWDIKKGYGIQMKDIEELCLEEDQSLYMTIKNNLNPTIFLL